MHPAGASSIRRFSATSPIKRATLVRSVSIAIVTCVFLIDIQVELGVGTYMLYIPALALAARLPGRRFVVALSIAATALSVLGYLASPVGGEVWKATVNSVLGVCAIWMTTAILVQHERMSSDRDRAIARADATERESVTRQHESRASSLALEAAEESERARMAREVHDALGQPLAALKFDMDWLSARLETSDDSMRHRVEEMHALVGNTIETVRRLATELRPSILDDVGLLAAIRSHTAAFTKRTGIRCELNIPSEEPSWSRDRYTTVFRILQEALTNVLRHAGATCVEVDLEERGQDIHLVVRDDGRGLGRTDAPGSQTLGLRGMHERARLHGGAIEVRNTGREGGTTVSLQLPRVDGRS
jgi:signal transduction histidine kinase